MKAKAKQTALTNKWFPSLEGREAIEKAYTGSKVIRDRLAQILEKEIEATNQKSSDYDVGSWAYKQAHMNGMCEAFKIVLGLITQEVDQSNE